MQSVGDVVAEMWNLISGYDCRCPRSGYASNLEAQLPVNV